ncbi:MAG TPA: c-type cytochrome [Ignavibacteria bacterium]|nr:c-type cytochrome [Ignavibacteria bacterium]
MLKANASIILLLVIMLTMGCGEDSVTVVTIPPYDTASSSRGGILFDKFWSLEAGFNQNDTNMALYNSRPDFFRCSHCHGWDNLGRFGSYIGRGPNNDRPNVAGMNLYSIVQNKTPQELFNTLNSSVSRRDITFEFGAYVPGDPNDSAHKMPNYGQILTYEQMWDLVKFLKEGALDVTQIYDASYSGTYPNGSAVFYNIGRDGNSLEGSLYYSANCSSCHGVNGTSILIGNMSAGQFTRSYPFEVQHKVKYGQLGTSMTGKFEISLLQLKNLFKALSDTSAFPDNL